MSENKNINLENVADTLVNTDAWKASEKLVALTHAFEATSTAVRDTEVKRDAIASDLKIAENELKRLPDKATEARKAMARVKVYDLREEYKAAVKAVEDAHKARTQARIEMNRQEDLEKHMASPAGMAYASRIKPEMVSAGTFSTSGYAVFKRLFDRNNGVQVPATKDKVAVVDEHGEPVMKWTIKDLTKAEAKTLEVSKQWTAFSEACDNLKILVEAWNVYTMQAMEASGKEKTTFESKAKTYKVTSRVNLQRAYDALWFMCGFVPENSVATCPQVNNHHFQFVSCASVTVREKRTEGITYKPITASTIRKRVQQLFWADLNNVRIADLSLSTEDVKTLDTLTTPEALTSAI
jgi:hypothetical protein